MGYPRRIKCVCQICCQPLTYPGKYLWMKLESATGGFAYFNEWRRLEMDHPNQGIACEWRHDVFFEHPVTGLTRYIALYVFDLILQSPYGYNVGQTLKSEWAPFSPFGEVRQFSVDDDYIQPHDCAQTLPLPLFFEDFGPSVPWPDGTTVDELPVLEWGGPNDH